MDGLPVHLAVLTIADHAAADRASGRAIAERATAAGHQIVDEEIAKDSESAIRDQLVRWIADDNVDVVIVAASIESEAASAALAPLVHQAVPGFTDLFRWLTFQEIGASAMLSAAEAAQCQSTFVFVLPAHEAAVRAAMDKLILPQLDVRTKPKNLVAQMPRLKDAAKRYAEAHKSQPVTAPPPVAATPLVPAPPTIPAVPRTDAVPSAITGEKTQGGSGLPARLPASPSAPPVSITVPAIPAAPSVPARPKTRTANTIARKADDPPTKPIDLAKLEKQIALSNANDAHTKEVDLKAHDAKTKVIDMSAHQAKTRVVDSRLLPRVPPGADDTAADLDDEPLTFSAPPGTNPAQAQAQAQAQARTAVPIGVVKNRSDGTQPGTPAPTRPVTTPPFSTPVARSSAATPPTSTPVARSSAATPPTSTPVARTTSSPPPTPRATSATPPALPVAPPGPVRYEVLTPSTPVVALRENDRKEAITPASPVVALRQDAGTESTTPAAKPIMSRHDAITPVATPIVPRKEATTPVTNPALAPQRPRSPTPPPPPPVRQGAAPNAAELWAQSMTAPTSEAAKPAAAVEPTPEATKPATASNGESTAADSDAPSPISNLFANQPARKRQPTPPPVHLESLAKPILDGDLPQGDFAYPIKRSGAGLLLKIVLALAMLGIGFFAFIKLYPQGDKPTQTAAVTPPPAEPAPPPAPAPAAAVVDAEQAAEPADIEIDPAQPATPGSAASPSSASPSSPPPSSSHSSSRSTSRPVTKPSDTSSDTKPADTKPADTKPADSNAADTKPGDKPDPAGDCDEVSCVLAKYDRPCCARYKPAEGFTPKNVVPDELDRAMVKTGVERIKPKVVACGEQHAAKGTVRLAVTVDPDGNVKGASVTESPEAGLGECVAGAMRNAKFGKSVKGGEFNYPFVF